MAETGENIIHFNVTGPQKEPDRTENVTGAARDQLRAIVERVERLDEELKSINDDKKEVFAEAKGNGFDTKAIKRVVQLRQLDPLEREQQQEIVDLYMHALGMAGGPEADHD